MMTEADIEVQMTFLPTEAGGRKTPALSGYRPQFHYNGHDWDALHNYGEVTEVHPGETVTAYLTFLIAKSRTIEPNLGGSEIHNV